MPLSVAGRTADRLIQGTAMLEGLPREDRLALLDAVHELGATTFDLAENYGRGAAERAFGDWLAQARPSEPPFVITKGGHPYDGRKRLRPEDVRADLTGSLERLGLDVVDLYLLHRDDEDVPVGEIVEFLGDVRQEGLIRAYGVSNWRAERVQAAQAYAHAHHLHPLAASSPNYSLAVPAELPWPGCVTVSGPEGAEARDYYARTGLPVLAWSSLAMGYFVLGEGAEADDVARSLGARVFDTPANAARRDRARRLAEAEGSTSTRVALRYVLSQPMDVHAVAGCRDAEEYQALRDAAQRPLTPAQVRWLEEGGQDTPPDV